MKRFDFFAKLPEGIFGFAIYSSVLFSAMSLLPPLSLRSGETTVLLGIGALAMWRYSWGILNFIRSIFYRKFVFPKWRALATDQEAILMPSQIYILMTVFRIKADIASQSIRAAISEAARSGIPTTLVASVVEKQDELLFKSIFNVLKPPEFVRLKIVRIEGTGKRDGLAHGFKAISRDLPAPDALVIVMDGDTVLLPDSIRKSVPFFKMHPNLGAVTTDEICELSGTRAMKEWHDLRFAQRQIFMSSVSLSKRVMTLTGRMSVFRADIVTHPDFISHITEDRLDHWRLGRFRFLTGDDKSSLFWIMQQQGIEQIYIPDTQVLTLEDPPSSNFFKASTQLMFRWYGNMLRTNARILKIGPFGMPLFVWWTFVDQRISMWTTLAGPILALMLTFRYGSIFLLYYFVWVGFIRWIMTLMIMTTRNKISWTYPFLLYYTQVYGALVKTWVLFRLDVQSWTRQKTKLQRSLSTAQHLWNTWSSHVVHAATIIIFISAIGVYTSSFEFPHSAVRSVLGSENYTILPL